ncbi:MAG TPA: ABC transporter permease [Vicinamibacterales bacterium]
MGVFQDLRFAVRMLFKDRWFTFMAVVVLSLGLGANNAVFTLVNAVLLRDLPFPKPEQIMMVVTRDARARDTGISLRDFEDWQASARTFSNMSFVFAGAFNVGDEGQLPEQYPGSYVSSNFFRMLGVTPALGRDFTPGDDKPGAPPVVLIGSTVWKQRYGSAPSVLGRTIRLNALTVTIVGVMPDGMKFPFNADIWMPAGTLPPAITQQPRQARGYFAVGRLADGVTVDQARAELKVIGAKLAQAYPDTNRELAPYADPFTQRILGPQIRLLLWSLMGAVGFVLLIACSNVANLLLARAAGRSNEMSVRVAIGASRWHIVRQLLVESLLLALVAGAVGLVLSIAGIRWFDAEAQTVGRPYWMVFTMDWRTFGFLLLVCVVTGLIFGLAPALHASRTNVHEMLKEGGRTGSAGVRARRWTAALIVVQLALTLVLLAGAGFMTRSFLSMYQMDIGISTSRMLSMNMILSARKYPSLEDRTTFLRRIDQHFANIAEIEAASTTTNTPFGGGAVRQLEIDGKAADGARAPEVTMLSVGARYFDVLGVRLVRGRNFTDTDSEPGRHAVIINQRLATMYFAGQDPLNRLIRLKQDVPGAEQPNWLTVIGVAPNVRQRNNNQEREPDPVAYVPHSENSTMARAATVLARTRSDPGRAARMLREAMVSVDPDQALFNPRSLDEQLAQQRWPLRVFGTMFTAFALIALVLAGVGLYAVTAYLVTQHTRDIGVRMVLGAQPSQVIWVFLRRAFVQLTIGLTIGIAAAFGVGRLLQTLLVQTSPRDPVTLISIVVLVTVVGVVACLGPARRATRLDPLIALRHE